MNGRVSVIMPAYNAAATIETSLDSLERQKYKNLEVVVVDDGSADSTEEKVQSFMKTSSLDIKFIKQINSGAGVARNRGIEETSGAYVFFLDSDDCISEDCIERLVSALESRHADLAYCGYDIVHELDEKKPVQLYTDNFSYTEKDISGRDALEKFLKAEISIWVASSLYRRSFLDAYSIRFTPHCYFVEDTEFFVKALAVAGKVTCVPDSMAYYYQNPASTTHWSDYELRKRPTVMEVYLRLEKYLKEKINLSPAHKILMNDILPWAVWDYFDYLVKTQNYNKVSSELNNGELTRWLKLSLPKIIKRPDVFLKISVLKVQPKMYARLFT